MQERLRSRTVKCKEETGILFLTMGKAYSISVLDFYSFVNGGVLPIESAEMLNKYLKNLGF